MQRRTPKAWLTVLALLAVVTVISVPAMAFDFSELENSVAMKKLDNGLTMIVLPRHDAPVASFLTYANVGSVNDPKGYTGLAHMFEHMAFKGTAEIGTTDYEKEIDLMRVEDSIFALLRAERLKGMLADQEKIAQLETDFQAAIDAAYEVVVPNAFLRDAGSRKGRSASTPGHRTTSRCITTVCRQTRWSCGWRWNRNASLNRFCARCTRNARWSP